MSRLIFFAEPLSILELQLKYSDFFVVIFDFDSILSFLLL